MAEKEKTWKDLFYCTHKQANACIVNREEAYTYIDNHKLKVMFKGEAKDGTPRRIWSVLDPEGHMCGYMYTAIADLGTKNKENFKKDSFDFLEIRVGREEYVKDDAKNYPKTNYFLSKE